MTSQMHPELTALISQLYSEEISEEEWALLQIHMGYCDSGRQVFLIRELEASKTLATNHAKAAPQSSGHSYKTDGPESGQR